MAGDHGSDTVDTAHHVSPPHDATTESASLDDDNHEPDRSRDSALFGGQDEIISQLEVDSNRSDNDSSLGSEITS
ncbi:hypothetical protein PFICI_08812 [Pestalotiopsis fici W106-1]|uniref:Uncharacterized protein n=1 Tax=Pestalotiopsis fici (strain W106-1 / CGMCC3.15140) TaxID=1229662 RepID=W3WYU8_PESFW|nr:uncharacterized protein PFICI_08812 [Pestalotiopsis fici W106-1]ETS78959.1 hypothetical protein PFICI_08812 [Pestalotiopsis fici W106-1]